MKINVGLLVRLEAKRGREADVERFIRDAVALAQAEAGTIVWFGIRLGPSTFGIFDAFADDTGRSAHLSGPIAAALGASASELLAEPPTIERVDVLGSKLPVSA